MCNQLQRVRNANSVLQVLHAQHVALPLAAPTATLQTARDALEARCIAILTAYRRHCAVRSSSEGQLILPESLKLLPLYVTMLFKTAALAPGVPPDLRAAALYGRSCMTVRGFSMATLPRLVDIAAAQQVDGVGWVPAAWLPVSGESVASSGAYLLEDSEEVRPQAPRLWCSAVVRWSNARACVLSGLAETCFALGVLRS